ncbi:Uncharacterized protein TCM_006772 [Theobroma cacao]|uniref:Uncharacterized protein n=1 Tax=Theobroma cacao TaxID=3641 RepID=A0A061E6F0_THECC|nr:Uncharacterized protein TCM_006772 [Theobroma cacao]
MAFKGCLDFSHPIRSPHVGNTFFQPPAPRGRRCSSTDPSFSPSIKWEWNPQKIFIKLLFGLLQMTLTLRNKSEYKEITKRQLNP